MISSLEIKNLHIALREQDDNYLVNDVSFIIRKGETLGIVGESGSGKTLTAMAIADLLPNSIEVKKGEIIIHENSKRTDFLKLANKEKRKIRGKKISVIFQEPMSSLNPSIKCGKQVAEIIQSHTKGSLSVIKKKVLDLFRETDLPNPEKIFKSYPFQLSGGQQQRVMIAMSIANNPDFILADEPTTALDVLVQKKIINLLKNIQAKYGMGIIFISHDIDLVANISSKMVVMRNGIIEEQGDINNIIKSPKSLYTKGLIRCKPRPETENRRLKTIDSFDNNKNKKAQNKETYPIKVSKDPILKFKNVDIYYETAKNLLGKATSFNHAVKNVSFHVFEFETFGVVGGSGSGKSTLGKSIIRLVEKMDGEIWYQSKNITNLSQREFKCFRRKIQLIFQDPYSSLNPKIKIGEAIKEVIAFHGLCKNEKEAKEKAISLLDDVKLNTGYYNRYPHELSGGQRQRVVIARALAVEPEFIICDESVSALDVSIQAEVLNLSTDTPVVRIERVRNISSTPTIYETIVLPAVHLGSL